MIAIEIGGALFELGEILNGAQRSFRSMNALVEHSPQAYGIDAKPGGLRPDVRRLMKRRIGVKIGMAVEARHAEALVCRLAVLGLIEFLLRERHQQQAQALKLYRREDADHQ